MEQAFHAVDHEVRLIANNPDGLPDDMIAATATALDADTGSLRGAPGVKAWRADADFCRKLYSENHQWILSYS